VCPSKASESTRYASSTVTIAPKRRISAQMPRTVRFSGSITARACRLNQALASQPIPLIRAGECSVPPCRENHSRKRSRLAQSLVPGQTLFTSTDSPLQRDEGRRLLSRHQCAALWALYLVTGPSNDVRFAVPAIWADATSLWTGSLGTAHPTRPPSATTASTTAPTSTTSTHFIDFLSQIMLTHPPSPNREACHTAPLDLKWNHPQHLNTRPHITPNPIIVLNTIARNAIDVNSPSITIISSFKSSRVAPQLDQGWQKEGKVVS